MIKALISKLVGDSADRGGAETAGSMDGAMPKVLSDRERLPLLVEELDRVSQSLELSEEERYVLAEKLARSAYPKFLFSEFGRIWLDDRSFLKDYVPFMDAGNWHSADRKFLLSQLVRSTKGIAGDFAECGAYAGGSAIFMCRTAYETRRHVHLFDSFEGLSSPTDVDGSYWKQGGLASGEDLIQTNLAAFSGQFTTYKGWIPTRFAEVQDRQFAFVHIDVDLYEPTRDCLAFFYPRVPAGGVILLDDHGFSSCPGARKAALEFFDDKPERIVDVTTGQGLVIKR